MSDQTPLKPSTSDASKTFAIPARPSKAAAKGQKSLSWKTAGNNQEPDAQPYTQEQIQSDEDTAAPAAQQSHAPEQSFAQAEPWVDFLEARLPEARSAPAMQRTVPQQEPRSSKTPPARAAQWTNSQTEERRPEMSLAHAESLHTAPTLILDVVQPLQPPQPPLPAANLAHAQRYQREEYTPGPVSPPLSQRKTRKGRTAFFVALPIITLIIVIGGLLGQQLFTIINTTTAQNSALVFSGNGPYVQLPLTAQQINAIQHLAGHMKYKALASLYVSQMSLDDEIGQLIMVEYNQPSYSSDLDYMVNTLHVGGVIMYEFQMTSASQTKGDIAHMQQRANIPLLISTDEEGGPYVHRLSNIDGYRMSATQIEQSGNLDVARQQGLKTSRDLAALGINEDLAPDVDVNQVNGYDMVTRTFGNTPDQVIKYAGAYLQSMQGNGTIACIKHFPGLGGALTDAHKGLPVVNSTKQQIYDIDLAPFKTFIQSPNALLNPGMIMPTDVLLPAIDPKLPAELSPLFMTDILRNEFGYDGVSLTDALYMEGITNTWDMYTASVMALQAGNDMLLGANGTQQTIGVINAIKQALQNGQLTKARIDESVARIIALKMQYHLMPTYIPEA